MGDPLSFLHLQTLSADDRCERMFNKAINTESFLVPGVNLLEGSNQVSKKGLFKNIIKAPD